jgi:hypothetical protein
VSLHLFDVQPLFAREPGIGRLHRAHGPERAHFGHAPGMNDFHPIHVLEGLGHGTRTRGPPDHDLFEIGQLVAGGCEMLQQHEPDRRNSGAARHLIAVEQLVD